MQSAYGSAIADVPLVAAPFALLALVIAAFLKEVVLRGRDEPDAALATDGPDGPDAQQQWNSPADHEPRDR